MTVLRLLLGSVPGPGGPDGDGRAGWNSLRLYLHRLCQAQGAVQEVWSTVQPRQLDFEIHEAFVDHTSAMLEYQFGRNQYDKAVHRLPIRDGDELRCHESASSVPTSLSTLRATFIRVTQQLNPIFTAPENSAPPPAMERQKHPSICSQ